MATLLSSASSLHSFSKSSLSNSLFTQHYNFLTVNSPNKHLQFKFKFKFSSIQPIASINKKSSSASSSSSLKNKTEPMIPPYNVLITGSSKGIGYALAKEFLKAGDNVIICSRSAERVESAVQSLKLETGKQHVV